MENIEQFPLFENLENGDIHYLNEENQEISSGYSDFVVYVDESGDHNLTNVNNDYPVFVLALAIFHKRYYAEKVVPALEKFKFNYFGHDLIVLHEHEIRKQKNAFKILINRDLRTKFIGQLTEIIHRSKFVLVSCTIDKFKLKQASLLTDNPYHIALGHCLNALQDYLIEKKQENRRTHILVECRGKKEDKELELAFRRICDIHKTEDKPYNFDIVFVDKKANSSGLQLADLIARPIGLNHLRPHQTNRAYNVLIEKFLCRGGRHEVGKDFEGYGNKVYP